MSEDLTEQYLYGGHAVCHVFETGRSKVNREVFRSIHTSWVTFSALDLRQRMKNGSALPSVSSSLLREVCRRRDQNCESVSQRDSKDTGLAPLQRSKNKPVHFRTSPGDAFHHLFKINLKWLILPSSEKSHNKGFSNMLKTG